MNGGNNDDIALDGKSALGGSNDMSSGGTHMLYGDNRATDREGGRDNSDQWAWEVIAVHFTTPTHHPLSERRCLDINSPRSDPECMWLLCPGYR